MADDPRPGNAPQSVTRVVRILDALCASGGPVSLAELSRQLDSPKSSLAALLRGLAAEGFVIATNGAYTLGPNAFGLGSALLEARRRGPSADLIREGMERLAARSGETVLFAVADADGHTLTYVDVVESRNAVRFAVARGDRRPLYCTAAGRMLLAAAGEARAASYLQKLRAIALTASTETTKEVLADAINAARHDGVAQTVNQAADGVTGTAAAIHDAAGNVLGALTVAAPSSRLHDRHAELARLVREEAAAISRSLGYRKASN